MDIYVDATTLIALEQVGELDLLTVFDGQLVVTSTVLSEIRNEPAATNTERFCRRPVVDERSNDALGFHTLEWARDVLDESETNGDVEVVAGVGRRPEDWPVAVVSDDRRVRTVARGLGATVTGTIGVVVRNVADGELTVEEAKALIRRLDSHGLHMTGELREKADELIDEAAEEPEE